MTMKTLLLSLNLVMRYCKGILRRFFTCGVVFYFRREIRGFVHEHEPLTDHEYPVLIWDGGNYPYILIKNAILALGLRLRGYKTYAVICDGAAFACIQRGIEHNEKPEDWSRTCRGCFADMNQTAKKYDLSCLCLGDYIDAAQRTKFHELAFSIALGDILSYKYLDVGAGSMAWSSFNRYLKGRLIEIDSLSREHEMVFRNYFYAALLITYVADKILSELKPVALLISHGVYTDYGPPAVLASQKEIPTLSWLSGYSIGSHYFTARKKEGMIGLANMSEAEWQDRARTPLTVEENKRLDHFLYQRYFGGSALDLGNLNQPRDKESLRAEFGIDNHKPIVCLFAHVNWDFSFDMFTMFFSNPNSWILESMRKMMEITDINWIIRMHPGEMIQKAVFSTGDLIRAHFKVIPSHMKILRADSNINTYGLYQLIDVGITIFGTPGLELAVMGKPVILAGKAHYGEKGFSCDVHSREEYFKSLEKNSGMKRLSDEQIELARRYAYSYFIERQIPFPWLARDLLGRKVHWGDLDLKKLPRLMPGKDKVMELLCLGLIQGRDVVLDAASLAE